MNIEIWSLLGLKRKPSRFDRWLEKHLLVSAKLVPPDSAGGDSNKFSYLLVDEQDCSQVKNLVGRLKRDQNRIQLTAEAATRGKKHWFIQIYEQEYHPKLLARNQQIELYYKKLGLGKNSKRPDAGESYRAS